MIRHLRRFLEYDGWANKETLDSLRQARPPDRSLRWMAHIVGAECVWLARLRQEPASLAVWPEIGLEECGEQLAQLSRSWPAYLDDHAEALSGTVPYTNSKGDTWTSSVEDILTHVTIHSAYHRGQIATNLRAAGMVPAYTDFIHAVRHGYVS